MEGTNIINIPIINTAKMDEILKDTVKLFKGGVIDRITPLWICGRSQTFGWRPSFKKTYLPAITRHWIDQLSKGKIIIAPIVFYACADNDVSEEERRNKFLVFHHYNLLITRLTPTGGIHIERYEPSDADYQGNLDERLSKLLIDNFKEHTGKTITYNLVGRKGLQAVLKDKTLCGHHIIYWLIYRFKHGQEEFNKLLRDSTSANEKFITFCKCMSNYQRGCVVNI